MGITSVYILGFLYLLWGIVQAFLLIHAFMKKRTVTYLTLARIMYLFIYSIIPAATHFYVYRNGNIGKAFAAISYSSAGIAQLYLTFMFSIIGLAGLLLGYHLVCGKYAFHQENAPLIAEANSIETSYSSWMIAGLIMLCVGGVSQVIWTHVYGGVQGILKYASSLRSGYDIGINNPYTVFKRFVPLVQFANIIFAAMWVKSKKFLPALLCMVSAVLSVFYLLANDGRAPMIMHFLSIIVMWESLSKSENKMKLWRIILLGVVSLFLIHNFDNIIVKGEVQSFFNIHLSFDLLATLREEFSFTVRDGQAVLEYLQDNPFSFRLPKEIISGVLGIMPSSFRPDFIEKLEILNTRYWTQSTSTFYGGGKPPDIISVGIYTMNYLGIFLLPAIYGRVLRALDNRQKQLSRTDGSIKFCLLLYPVMRTIAYANFDGIALNLFYVFLSYTILWLVKTYDKGRKINE